MMVAVTPCEFGTCRQPAKYRITYRSAILKRKTSTADVCVEHSLNWPRSVGTVVSRAPLPAPQWHRCEISPCTEAARFVVTFRKKIGTLEFPGSAKVCAQHEKNWPTRNWGRKTGSAQYNPGDRMPRIPKQYGRDT